MHDLHPCIDVSTSMMERTLLDVNGIVLSVPWNDERRFRSLDLVILRSHVLTAHLHVGVFRCRLSKWRMAKFWNLKRTKQDSTP